MRLEQLVDRSGGFGKISASSRIKDVSLQSFLQIIGIEKNTCLLEVRTAGHAGFLWLDKGEVASAFISKEVKGKEALFSLLAAEDAEILIKNVSGNFEVDNEFNTATVNLLLEAAKVKDENEFRKTAEEKTKTPQKGLLDIKNALDYHHDLAKRHGIIVKEMIVSAAGNVIHTPDRQNSNSRNIEILTSSVLKIAKYSAEAYGIDQNDYVCILGLENSIYVSRVDNDLFFVATLKEQSG